MIKAVNFFEDNKNIDDICSKLAEDYDRALTWEHEIASICSPGPVENKELVARQIHSPIHIDNEGKVTPAAFDDAMKRGMSVHRLAHISMKAVHLAGEKKAEIDRENRDPHRKYCGAVVANVLGIRMVIDPGDRLNRRCFCVYDTALPTIKEHADVFLVVAGNKMDTDTGNLSKKARKRQRRQKLREQFGELQIGEPE